MTFLPFGTVPAIFRLRYNDCTVLRTRPPWTGVKTPKIGKIEFRCQKTHSPRPRKGRFESKNPHFSPQGATWKMGIFWLETTFSGARGNGVFWLRNPLFPILGFLTPVQGRRIRKTAQSLSEPKNCRCSAEGQKRHQNLAPVLVIISGASLVFYDFGVFDTCAGLTDSQNCAITIGKSWFLGRGWGQQLFSFQSPAVHWIAQTSSLNCLSCRNPHQTPHSLNCLPPFHWKPLFFTEKCFVASPSTKNPEGRTIKKKNHSRSKFSISIENFNRARKYQSRRLDLPAKNRAAVGGSLENFILARSFQSRSLDFFDLWALRELCNHYRSSMMGTSTAGQEGCKAASRCSTRRHPLLSKRRDEILEGRQKPWWGLPKAHWLVSPAI